MFTGDLRRRKGFDNFQLTDWFEDLFAWLNCSVPRPKSNLRIGSPDGFLVHLNSSLTFYDINFSRTVPRFGFLGFADRVTCCTLTRANIGPRVVVLHAPSGKKMQWVPPIKFVGIIFLLYFYER